MLSFSRLLVAALFAIGFVCRVFAIEGWTNTPWSVQQDHSLGFCSIAVIAHVSKRPWIRRSEHVSDGLGGSFEAQSEFELVIDTSLYGRLKPGLQRVLAPSDPAGLLGGGPFLRVDFNQKSLWILTMPCAVSRPSGPLYPLVLDLRPLSDVPFLDAVFHDRLGPAFGNWLHGNRESRIRALYYLAPFRLKTITDASVLAGIAPTWQTVEGWPQSERRHTEYRNEILSAMHDTDAHIRIVAMLTLFRMFGKDSSPYLRPFLTDSNTDVRCAAATLLLKNRDGASVAKISPVLHEMLVEPKPDYVLSDPVVMPWPETQDAIYAW